ncbi:MAG: LacI family DNA-binding transcriptional regulator [Phycisphaeraceae bacterium]|nr:LacI family DNA-binding transcriptional regulator [Phycisphaeraceae bacterium]
MITMQDIVRKVGVSRAAVSHVLGNASGRSTIRVSEKTRQKILQTAKELSYRPNELARSVVTGKSKVVAFVANKIQYDYSIRGLEGVMTQANEMGYAVKVFQDLAPGQIDYIADQCISHRVCGVICSHFTNYEFLLDALLKANIPIALPGANSASASLSVLQARTDNQQGFDQAIAHLHGMGHQRIGMISGDMRSLDTTDRVEAFKQAMVKHQLEINSDSIMYAGEWEVGEAHICADRMLSQSSDCRPTAICCASDILAMGVLRAARRLHLEVPKDLSVVGLGNMYVSELSDPPLTTIAQDDVTTGRTLFARLVESSSDPTLSPTVIGAMHLIPRESTRPPPELNTSLSQQSSLSSIASST